MCRAQASLRVSNVSLPILSSIAFGTELINGAPPARDDTVQVTWWLSGSASATKTAPGEARRCRLWLHLSFLRPWSQSGLPTGNLPYVT